MSMISHVVRNERVEDETCRARPAETMTFLWNASSLIETRTLPQKALLKKNTKSDFTEHFFHF